MKVSALDQLASKWRRTYEAVNNKEAPSVVWKNGWFVIDGKRYRRSALEAMHTRLQKIYNASPGG